MYLFLYDTIEKEIKINQTNVQIKDLAIGKQNKSSSRVSWNIIIYENWLLL